jgi:hypothetical protein
VLKYFSVKPPENSGGAENSTEISGPYGKKNFCSVYELSQRHPVWVAEINVTACNSVQYVKTPAKMKTPDSAMALATARMPKTEGKPVAAAGIPETAGTKATAETPTPATAGIPANQILFHCTTASLIRRLCGI